MSLCVIDADSPAWWAAIFIDKDIVNGDVDEDDHEEIAKRVCGSVKRTINKIIDETGCDEYLPVLSGANNFRKVIYPEYKANRAKADRPPYLYLARQYLIDHHGAHVTEGMEADDYLGIAGYGMDDVILSHYDKDIDMIAGKHHNFQKGHMYEITEIEGLRKFYTQILSGDSTDNILGLYRLTGKKALKRIKEPLLTMNTQSEMWEYIKDVYLLSGFKDGYSMDDVVIQAQCLWILREEGQLWHPPE